LTYYFEILETQHFKVPNQISALDDISLALDEFCESASIQMKLKLQINLVLEELVTNIIKFGYDDTLEHFIDIEIKLDSTFIQVIITDDAGPFNILDHDSDVEINKPADERSIGGVGIHLVRTLMDEITYKRESGKNILLMSKSLS
jgi:anti-sigma regulatory factor (Ser/Thr protein kinase)